jgi:hypothetical protein
MQEIIPKNRDLELPINRCDHVGAVVDEYIYLFSGSDPKKKPLNDMWRFNTNALLWEKITQKGSIPEARTAAIMIGVNKKLYFYGGGKGISEENIRERWKSLILKLVNGRQLIPIRVLQILYMPLLF